ncbi:AAA family ATPase [Streptomyces xiamenensis]|uniref:AAA family ATPase n=1 Tax=Streptomyces xiamenensis TaxID=408015 RepID=UPI0035E27EBA
MTDPTATPEAPKTRRGELRRAVAYVLAAEPTRAFRVQEVSKTLGRSSGAVGNALETLAERGAATLTSTSPRQYKANHNTAAAAAPLPPSARPDSAPATLAVPKPSPAPDGAIRRPGGQIYRPRDLASHTDVDALRQLREAEVPVLLYGPPGTGKTSLAEAAFPDLITVTGDGDMSVGDLIGEWNQNDDGAFEFLYGPVVNAMMEGRALLIDDATLISPKVLAALYPAMDGRKQIQVKAHKGETITAKKGFYVIAGHNPGVHGAILTEALSSRFSCQIQVSSDYDLAASLKIDSQAVRIARNLAKLRESDRIGWAPQLRELIAFQKIAGVLGREAAFSNLIGVAPVEDQDAVAGVVSRVWGKEIKPLSLGAQRK